MQLLLLCCTQPGGPPQLHLGCSSDGHLGNSMRENICDFDNNVSWFTSRSKAARDSSASQAFYDKNKKHKKHKKKISTITNPQHVEFLSWDLLNARAHCLPSKWGQESPHWVMSTKARQDSSTLNPAYQASISQHNDCLCPPSVPSSLLQPLLGWTCLKLNGQILQQSAEDWRGDPRRRLRYETDPTVALEAERPTSLHWMSFGAAKERRADHVITGKLQVHTGTSYATTTIVSTWTFFSSFQFNHIL